MTASSARRKHRQLLSQTSLTAPRSPTVQALDAGPEFVGEMFKGFLKGLGDSVRWETGLFMATSMRRISPALISKEEVFGAWTLWRFFKTRRREAKLSGPDCLQPWRNSAATSSETETADASVPRAGLLDAEELAGVRGRNTPARSNQPPAEEPAP